MSTKYRAWPSMPEIKPVEILRETDKMVVIASPDTTYYKNGERRELKKTDDWAYFDTWMEAKNFMVERVALDLKNLYDRADRLETKLAKIKEMQEPKA